MEENKLSQSQIDIILAEAYTECFIIKQKFGEETLVRMMKMFGGKRIEIPTTEQFSDLCKIYYGQDGFQTSYLKTTTKELIKYIRSNNKRLKSPSQLRKKIISLSHKLKVDLSPFTKLFFDW